MRNKFRVLLDWDNDGFINSGVPVGTPPNLLPYPAYAANLYPKNQPSSGVLEDAEYLADFDEHGLLMMHFDITAGFPSYFGVNMAATTDSYTFAASSYTLQLNTNYCLSFYVKSATDVTVNVYRGDISAATETLVTSVASIVCTDWTVVQIDLGSDADFTNFFVTVERSGGGNAEIDVKGVMLVEGADFVAFNTGELSAYDNISDYVLSASWELGRNQYDDPIAYEGTARVKLNNDSKLFSPANTSSALYGKLQQNIMMRLEYETSINVWTTLWTGWTSVFKTTAGRTGTRQSEIVATQGIYRLRDGDLDITVNQTMSINEAIIEILDNCGFRSTYYPLLTTLDFDARLGWNSWIQDAEQLFSHLSPSYRRLSAIGLDWGRKTSPAAAIEELLTAEHSKLWLDREGGWVLKHREDFVNTVADYDLILDTTVHDAEYVYGEDIINHVDVFIHPRKEITNQVIWSTKEPIYIAGHPFGDGRQNLYTKYVDMQFEFEEGKQRTITNIDGANARVMNVTVYKRNPRLYADPSPYEVSNSAWNGQVHATVLGYESLRRRLQVRNNLEYPVWVDVEVSGDYMEGAQGGLVTADDLVSQSLIKAVLSKKIDLPAVVNEQEALSYANHILHRSSLPVGEFRKLLIRDDPTIQIGDVLNISEQQTGETNRRHIVIGERGDYASGMLLEIEYQTARLDEQTYFAVGDTVINGITNIVPNILEDIVTSNAVFELVPLNTPEGDTAYRFNGGSYGAGVLFYGKPDAIRYDPDPAGVPANILNGWKAHAKSLNADGELDPATIDFNGDKLDFNGQTRMFSSTFLEVAANVDYESSYVPTGILSAEYATNIYFGILGGSSVTPASIRMEYDNIRTFGTAVSVGQYEKKRWMGIGAIASSVDFETNLNILIKNTVVGTGTDMVFGDFTLIDRQWGANENLILEQSSSYYLTLWFINNDIDYDIRINLSGDITSYINAEYTIPTGVYKLAIPFNTSALNDTKGTLCITPTTIGSASTPNTRDIYIYGISITEEEPDTFAETNETTPSSPVLYL